jgi:hypothetical protein
LFDWRLFLHGVGLKFPVVETTSDFDRLDWKSIQLKNWIKKTLRYQGVDGDHTVERTPSNFIIWSQERSGVDPYELFFESIRDLLQFAMLLPHRYGVKLGSPSLVCKPHFGLIDPLFKRINKVVQVSGSTEWTDESPASGSVEFFDPRRIVAYLRMPEKVDDIAKQLAEVSHVLSGFGEGIKDHMTLTVRYKT